MLHHRLLPVLLFSAFLPFACQKKDDQALRITRFTPGQAKHLADSIESTMKPTLAEGVNIRLWAVDSLVIDPIAIDIDDQGTLYYTRTLRQQNSEFDIRGHRDWEISSIKLQTVEDKRAFLRQTLSKENSDKNKWLPDLNGDGFHSWEDLAVEKERVYRVQDLSGDGVADFAQVMVDDFNDEVTDVAGGVLADGKDLYLAVGPDLWKLNDDDGDGLVDRKKSLSHGYAVHIGFGGHGMSGVEMGPEGKIYWQIGDIGFNGTDAAGNKWNHANSGVIVRSEPDGSDFEVFAYGNRNTHEFVFDEYGNLISEDNDGDQPGERERIVYVVNGGDLGWRINWQFGKYRDPRNNGYRVWMDERLHVPRFYGQAAYIIPPIANYVSGPTGMLYNPGTALNREWNNMFFVVEFNGNPASSGIHAFKLKPAGAGFELGESKVLAKGLLATGIDFGPDGALYAADWVAGWGTKQKGRVWRLDVDKADAALRAETKNLLAKDFTDESLEVLRKLLGHTDMRVRQKAQFELARRGDNGFDVFTTVLAGEQNQLARIHAIWGISQFARKDLAKAKHLVPLLKDRDPEIRAQAAKWIGDVRYKDAGSEVVALLKDDYARARFFAAEALGRMAHAPATGALAEALAANNDEDVYIRHAASLALARIGNADAIIALSSHRSAAVRMGAVLALRRMQHEGIRQFLQDGDSLIVTEAARAINDDLSIEKALPALADVLNTTAFRNEALIRRAINANVRIGTAGAATQLMRYAANEKNPPVMRAEALAAIATWDRPSVVDRVDGRYRGEVTHDLAALREAVNPMLLQLLDSRVATVRLEAMKAIQTFKPQQAATRLETMLKGDANANVRGEALRTLVGLQTGDVAAAVKTALKDKEQSVRALALDFLPQLNLPDEQLVSSLLEVILTRSVAERQRALLTLASVDIGKSQPAFTKVLAQYQAKKLPTEIYLELEEAIDSTHSAALQKQYRSIRAASSPDTLMASYIGALSGGDAARGERIFYQHQTAQCIRCHSLGDMGGSAGPRLNGIAARLTAEQRLQALIDPSARIAPGYGTASITLKSGKTINGIVGNEGNGAITVKRGNDPDTLIQATDIETRVNASSSMPPMRLLLTKKEIRDLMSFLATLTSEEH